MVFGGNPAREKYNEGMIARFALLLCLIFAVGLLSPAFVYGQTVISSATPSPIASSSADATAGAVISPLPASGSSLLSSSSAEVVQRIQEKTAQDITITSGNKKDVFVELLDQNPTGKLQPWNVLQHAIRRAISNGLPANIVVLVLLFPVIATFIAFSRHVIGLKGFGIYSPAVLSVAFLSTGIVPGIIFFVIVLVAALVTRSLVKRLKLQYLPRTAMLFLGVSLVTLLTLIAASFIQLSMLVSITIFPLLIIILLTENFMETQLASSMSEAVQLTVETLITALVCSLLIGFQPVQKWVLLQPEMVLIGLAFINLLIGKYTGLRLLEWWRFRAIIEK